MKKEKQHDKNLSQILREIEIQGPCIIAKEAQFFDEQRQLVCEPDGWLYDGREHIVLEYKCGPSHRHRALQQLTRAEEYIRNMFDVKRVRKLYVCCNKKPEEI